MFLNIFRTGNLKEKTAIMFYNKNSAKKCSKADQNFIRTGKE